MCRPTCKQDEEQIFLRKSFQSSLIGLLDISCKIQESFPPIGVRREGRTPAIHRSIAFLPAHYAKVNMASFQELETEKRT